MERPANSDPGITISIKERQAGLAPSGIAIINDPIVLQRQYATQSTMNVASSARSRQDDHRGNLRPEESKVTLAHYQNLLEKPPDQRPEKPKRALYGNEAKTPLRKTEPTYLHPQDTALMYK